MKLKQFLTLVSPASVPGSSETRSQLATTTRVAHDKSKANHVIPQCSPARASSFGSLRRCVLVVSHAELIISDGEHACRPSILYKYNIYISFNLF